VFDGSYNQHRGSLLSQPGEVIADCRAVERATASP